MHRDDLLHTRSPENTSAPRKKFWLRKPAYLVVIGVVLLALFIYAVLSCNSNRRYSAADVVYGKPYHASHVMPDGELGSFKAYPADISASSKPQVEIAQSLYNFGIVRSGQVVSHTFPLANRGNSPLIILTAHTTCSCTTADFTATEIPPGKVALMTVTFDTGYHDLRGQTVRRGILIETNDPKNQIISLWFQATIR